MNAYLLELVLGGKGWLPDSIAHETQLILPIFPLHCVEAGSLAHVVEVEGRVVEVDRLHGPTAVSSLPIDVGTIRILKKN